MNDGRSDPALPARIASYLLTSITQERRDEVARELEQGAMLSRDYLLFNLLSCVIATFGLVTNSPAVIIGAMLIAMLVPVILALALGIVRANLKLVARAIPTFVLGAGLAIGLSAVLGLTASNGAVNFLEELPSEVLGRTRPTLFDLGVALAGGAAATYALVHPRLSAALPGVAIATALMPPLCVVGIGLSQAQPDVALGALFLFLANVVAILLGGVLVFVSLGFRPPAPDHNARGFITSTTISLLLLLPIVVPLAAFLQRIKSDLHETQLIRDVLSEHLAQVPDSTLVDFDRQEQQGRLNLVVEVRSPRAFSYDEVLATQRDVAERIQRPVAIKLLVIPMTQLDTLVPPTRTPTLAPGVVVVPTTTLVPTASPSLPPTATSTTLPSRTPTTTLAPTSTASPAPTATPAPTYAVVAGTGGLGLQVHRAPGQPPVIAAISEGVIVQVLGHQEELDGLTWLEVVLPDGRVGWLAGRYLVPYQTYQAP